MNKYITTHITDDLRDRLKPYLKKYLNLNIEFCSLSHYTINNKRILGIIFKYDKELGCPHEDYSCKNKITKNEKINSKYTTPKLHQFLVPIMNKLEELFDIKSIYYTFNGVSKYKVNIECRFTREEMLRLISLTKILGLEPTPTDD